MSSISRPLIIIGALIILAGLAWPMLRHIPLFRLPGDIVVDRPGFKFMFPITSMIVISVVISLLSWLMRR
jgi:hypothetical protein